MLLVVLLAMAAFGSGWCAGVLYTRRRRGRKAKLPLKVIVHVEEDGDPLAAFLRRERRYLRLLGYGD